MNVVNVKEFCKGNYRLGRELEILEHFDLSDLSESTIEHIIYTIKHKKALIMTYIELNGYLPGYDSRLFWHDTEKLFMYLLLDDCKKASKLHLAYSIHHYSNWESEMDKVEAVLDYECARFTKHDKPLNAYETILKYKAEAEDTLGYILDKYEIHNRDYKDYSFNLYYEFQSELEEMFIENTLDIINQCFEYIETHTLEELLIWYNEIASTKRL